MTDKPLINLPLAERASTWLQDHGHNPFDDLAEFNTELAALATEFADIANAETEKYRGLVEAAEDAVTYGPCSDPDCCNTAIKNEAARVNLHAELAKLKGETR